MQTQSQKDGVRDEGEEKDQKRHTEGQKGYLSAPSVDVKKWREENSCLVTHSRLLKSAVMRRTFVLSPRKERENERKDPKDTASNHS